MTAPVRTSRGSLEPAQRLFHPQVWQGHPGWALPATRSLSGGRGASRCPGDAHQGPRTSGRRGHAAQTPPGAGPGNGLAHPVCLAWETAPGSSAVPGGRCAPTRGRADSEAQTVPTARGYFWNRLCLCSRPGSRVKRVDVGLTPPRGALCGDWGLRAPPGCTYLGRKMGSRWERGKKKAWGCMWERRRQSCRQEGRLAGRGVRATWEATCDSGPARGPGTPPGGPGKATLSPRAPGSSGIPSPARPIAAVAHPPPPHPPGRGPEPPGVRHPGSMAPLPGLRVRASAPALGAHMADTRRVGLLQGHQRWGQSRAPSSLEGSGLGQVPLCCGFFLQRRAQGRAGRRENPRQRAPERTQRPPDPRAAVPSPTPSAA